MLSRNVNFISDFSENGVKNFVDDSVAVKG